ncbi:hypothetical protein SEVIR_2G239566v4 [Setaria viridis]
MSSFCSEDAAYSVFNEVPLVDVSWDAMSTDPIVHEGLLQQLAQGTEEEMQCELVPLEAPIMFEEMHQGGEDLTGKAMKPTIEFSRISGASLVELNIDSMVLDGTCHENVVWDEDIKAISELVIDDMLN